MPTWIANNISPWSNILIISILMLHLTYDMTKERQTAVQMTKRTSMDMLRMPDAPTPHVDGAWQRPLPEVFIFRRTRKTGSSSMMAGLAAVLEPLGYTALPYRVDEIETSLHNELIGNHARRVMLLRHNNVTRAHHPRRDAIIADTIRSGLIRTTSFCRFYLDVKSCAPRDMRDCFRNETIQNDMRYRWAGHAHEDEDTYIDLPLSSAHPALSTAVLRTVFPNVTLHIDVFNAKGTSCEETRELRTEYEAAFPGLDDEDRVLWLRMMMIARYPVDVHRNVQTEPTLAELVDRAEVLERGKYKIDSRITRTRSMSPAAMDLRGMHLVWDQDSAGNLVPRSARSKSN